jgi:hypothetical protein
MFSLQMANQKVEVSAAGFFPINYTLVFSVSEQSPKTPYCKRVVDHRRSDHVHNYIDTIGNHSKRISDKF